MLARARTRSNPFELLVALTAGMAVALCLSSPHDNAVPAPATSSPHIGVDHSPPNPHRARRAGAYDTGLGIVIVRAPQTRTQADRVP